MFAASLLLFTKKSLFLHSPLEGKESIHAVHKLQDFPFWEAYR